MNNSLNIGHFVSSDTFCEIQRFLAVRDLFRLRSVSRQFRTYIDNELVKLKILQLQTNDKRIIDGFKVLCERCHLLETVNLSGNFWLSDELLSELIKNNAKSIRSLNLNKCSALTANVQSVIIQCVSLKKLRLQGCNWLTTGCLEALALHHSELEELDLSYCSVISNPCLIVLLTNFRKLRRLALAAVSSADDHVLFTISKYQTEIQHLNLFDCPKITDRGIGALSLNCKKLETLSIKGCEHITERSLELLRARSVHIDVPKKPTNAFILNYREFAIIHRDLYLQV